MVRTDAAGRARPLLITVLVLLGAPGALWGQSVFINGRPLATAHKPVTVAGSILLPMRDVFEALNAQVKWDAEQRTIIAVRGEKRIELRIGAPGARIDGRLVKLQAAPRLIGNLTYVPLRVPAEAFGGSVEWQPATRTALITIAAPTAASVAAAPSPQTPPAAVAAPPVSPPTAAPPVASSPTPPPAAEATRVEGTLLQVIEIPRSIVVSVAGSGVARAVTLGPDTGLFRHAVGQTPRAAQLAEAAPGEYAIAAVGPDGTAQSIDFSYGEAEGTVAGISRNSILLKDNSVYTVTANVAVWDQASRAIALWDVQPNVPVKLRYSPASRSVFEVRLATAPPPPPASDKPSIMLIGLANRTRVFRAGDVLKVQLQGTPAGTATATLAGIFRDLPLAETTAGVYEGEFTVRGNTNEHDLPLVGNLVVNGVQARGASTSTGIVIDTTPPAVTQVSPSDGLALATADAVIEACFDAGAGAPINPASAVLSLNGARVPGATATCDRIGYQAQDLPQGPVRAEVSVEDAAGNRVTRSWTFTVGNAGRALFAAGHDAREALPAGSVLTVSVRARKPGGVATFDVDALEPGLPMPRVGTSDLYRGEYVVKQGDSLSRGVVTVHYRDPDGVETNLDVPGRVTLGLVLPSSLAITSPAYGTRVGEMLEVRGEAPPAARVRVAVTYSSLSGSGGQLWRGVVRADAAGKWETRGVSTNLVWLSKPDEYLVKAEQLDADNEVVETKETRLVR